MTGITIPPFGIIDAQEPDECYETHIPLSDRTIEVDLWPDDYDWANPPIASLIQAIESIPRFASLAQRALLSDFETGPGSTAWDFCNFFIDSYPAEDFLELFQRPISSHRDILDALLLLRVGIYPDSSDSLIFDHQLPNGLGDQILVVSMSLDGSINHVAHES